MAQFVGLAVPRRVTTTLLAGCNSQPPRARFKAVCTNAMSHRTIRQTSYTAPTSQKHLAVRTTFNMAMSMTTNQYHRFQCMRASTLALETENPMISMKPPIVDIGLSMILQGNDIDTWSHVATCAQKQRGRSLVTPLKAQADLLLSRGSILPLTRRMIT